MALPDWVKTEDWDVLRLGGVRMPGIAKVKAKIDSNLDIKKPVGGKKASIKDNGDPLVELEVELDMSHADVVAFAELSPTLRPVTKNGARNPLKIDHPEALLWRIFNVVVADIGSEHPATGGRKTITIKLIEWAPGPAKVAAAAKKPADDAEDQGSWAAFATDAANRFFGGLNGKSSEPAAKNKPSSDAGKNI